MSKNEKPVEILELLPQKKKVLVGGLYLDHRLLSLSKKLGRPFVYADYVTDMNDVIAIKNEKGEFRIPNEIRNSTDWQFFQKLQSQADVIIISSSYLKRFITYGESAENVLTQFEQGSQFEALGAWRLVNGYDSRNPDIVIVSRTLDFDLPESLADRNVSVFTSNIKAHSKDAKRLKATGALVVGSGNDGVDGDRLIDYLGTRLGYRTIHMAAGPSVLKILLDAKVLDRLYLSQVQVKLSSIDLDSIITYLPPESKHDVLKDFKLTHKYHQDGVITYDGNTVAQDFFVYDNKRFLLEFAAPRKALTHEVKK
jgi:riboflavin biosynthesis pyrimidine reductase